MSDKLKNLTGKNPKDFEPAAFSLINNCDVELFSELVSKDDFLFDFVKQNVSDRLAKVCNRSNYLNLLNFLKYYSPSYEDFIISALVRFADEDLTDKMLDIFEKGTDDEKTYCAKFFSYIKDPLAIEFLKQSAYSENSCLSSNCASTLGVLNEETSYNEAVKKLESDDEFTQLDGVKFLVSYGRKDALEPILMLMKTSSFAENIAGEITYLCDLFSIYENSKEDALFVFNSIINGLGEILGLSQVFDFRLYEFIELLVKSEPDSKIAVVLVNALDKFETLTENDEYLFDESKDTKQEILDIKQLLTTPDVGRLYSLIDDELNAGSLFVYTALDFTENDSKIRELLASNNQTVVLKALETLKQIDSVTQIDKETALASVSNENIRNVIMAI